jgi:hypothetical protein
VRKIFAPAGALQPIPTLLGVYPVAEKAAIQHLLVEHGADPNDFAHATYESTHESWSDGRKVLSVYWPRIVLAGDVARARRLLTVHGAQPNWPFIVEEEAPTWAEGRRNDPGGAAAAVASEQRKRMVCGSGLGPYAGCGATVLMLAILSLNLPMVELLLEHGADVNQVEDVRSGHCHRLEEVYGVAAVEDLKDVALHRYLAGGADMGWCVEPECLATPLSIARGVGDAGIVALLVSKGATEAPRSASVPYLPYCTEAEKGVFSARAGAVSGGARL